MTAEPYGGPYARAYDRLYADKDYAIECDMVEASFRRHSPLSVKTILDLGCGTGGHARLLAQRGYRITAVDRSPQMLQIAREKPSAAAIDWICSDVREMNIDATFDAALLMFAVIGYFTADSEVVRALKNIRRHLTPGRLLCFDFWYGPAVLAIGPSDREKTVSSADADFTRRVSATLEPEQHTCHVRYHLQGRISGIDSFDEQEVHVVRYFFRDEIERFLLDSGFDLVSLTAFPSLDEAPDESTWNAFCVARVS